MIGRVLDVLGDLLPYAVGVALSPLPLIAVFLVLQSSLPRMASAAFIGGRFVTVAVIAVIMAFVAELLPEANGSSVMGAVLRILLGLALIVWAAAKATRWLRARDHEPELPNWMASIEDTTPARAARLAVILSAVNVKEVAFGIGAGLTIGAGDLGPGATVVAAIAYALVACSLVIIIVVTYWLAGDHLSVALDWARDWLVANNKVIVAGVLLVIGAILVGEGMRGLTP